MLSAFSNVTMLAPADVPVWGHGYSGELSAFERMGRGAILVDGRARVLEINACVRLGDGLQVLRGFLRAPQPADRERLKAIFEKTHTARQGELIALLAKLG